MLHSAKFTVVGPPIFTITGIDFANMDKEGKVMGSYGMYFEATDIRFLHPRITYDYTGTTSVDKAFSIKIIKPDGSIYTETSSPNGYSYNSNLRVQPNSRGVRVFLWRWGSESGGVYSAGTYTCEVWSDGQMLRSAKFTVVGPPTFTITGMDFANTEKDRNVIGTYGVSFQDSDIRFITPRITYDYTGSISVNRELNIKIINPDGSLDRGTSSPSGFSYNMTLNVQPNKRGERVLLAGWGSESGGTYPAGTYTFEVWSDGQMLRSARFTVTGSRVIIFLYDSPQGSRVRLYQNNQLLGTIAPNNTFSRTVSDGSYTFEVQIDDASISSNNPLRRQHTVNVSSNTVNVDIVARRMANGDVYLRDFSTRIVPR
jgi:membrane-bound inhibitor of C-type lysozyme